MLPSSTLNNCGNSSSEVFRRIAPSQVTRGSFRLACTACGPSSQTVMRAELPHANLLPVQAVAPLAEENRARRSELDQHGDHRHRHCGQQQQQAAETEVGEPLRQAVDAVERVLEHAHHRQAEDVGPARMEQLEDEEVGHDVDRGGRVAQLVEHAANAVFGPHGKRDVDAVDRSRPGPDRPGPGSCPRGGPSRRECPGCALRADRRRSPPAAAPSRGEASMFSANWKPNSLTPTMAKLRVL